MPKILDREKKAKELRDYGLTYKQVGESLGVGPQRARQIVNACERKEWDKEEWYSFLPTRIYNALINSGLVVKSKNDLIEAVESGDISYKNRKIKNYGKRSHLELCKLLGLNEPVEEKLLYAIAESEDGEVVLTIFNSNELVLNQALLGQLIDELEECWKGVPS